MRALLIGIVLLWPGVAPAQTAWTFGELLQQALISHPSVLARRAASSAAQSDVDSAEWQRFPTPSIEAQSNNISSTVPNSRLRIQQPLWAGGRIDAGIDAARSRKDAADSSITEQQFDLALRVAGAFVEAGRQQAREEYARRGVAEHERLLGLISRRVQQEVSPPVDRELALSRLYQAQNDLSATIQQRRTALTQLTQLAGRPIERVAALDPRVADAPPSQDIALDRAIAFSPTLARLTAEERAAAADVDTRRAAYWPTLGVRYEKDYGGPLADSRLMLVVEANPGAGLSAGSNVEAARSRQSQAQLGREVALRDVRERVTIDWNDFTSARDRMENAELARKTAAEVFESFTRQYTTGRKTWVDVMNSVRETTQAEFTAADVYAQVAVAVLRLNVETGQLLTVPAARPPK